MSHSLSNLPSGTVVHTWSTIITPRAIVILQHGFGEYAERYVEQYSKFIPSITRLGFEVRALDMWGHGRSPGTRGVTHVSKAVQDHILVRQQASKDYPSFPIFLFGHSLGGLVTAGSLVADPSHITGVVLTGPALPVQLPQVVCCLLGVMAALFPTTSIPLKPAPRSSLSRRLEVIAVVQVDEMMTKRRIPFLLAATALDTMETVRKGYDRWVVPTLILHGTADSHADPAGSRHLVGAIASKDKTLKLYEEGRHELLHDLDGSDALMQVVQWLEDHC